MSFLRLLLRTTEIMLSFNLSNTYEIEGVCYKKLERINEAISSFQMAIDLTSEGKYRNALQGLLNECKNIFEGGKK